MSTNLRKKLKNTTGLVLVIMSDKGYCGFCLIFHVLDMDLAAMEE